MAVGHGLPCLPMIILEDQVDCGPAHEQIPGQFPGQHLRVSPDTLTDNFDHPGRSHFSWTHFFPITSVTKFFVSLRGPRDSGWIKFEFFANLHLTPAPVLECNDSGRSLSQDARENFDHDCSTS